MKMLWSLVVPVVALSACATGSVVSQPVEESHATAEEPPTYSFGTPPAAPPPPVAEPEVDEGVAYYGSHPIPMSEGGGWCLIDGPHLHAYEPEWSDQYVFQNNYFYFGLNFPDWVFYDRHPVPPDEGGGWCGLTGYHHHRYRPWEGYRYDQSSNAYVYEPDQWHAVEGPVVRPSHRYRAPSRVVHNVARGSHGNVMHEAPPSSPQPMHPAPARPQSVPVPAPSRYPEPMRPAERPSSPWSPPPAARPEPARPSSPWSPPPAARPEPARPPPAAMQPQRYEPPRAAPPRAMPAPQPIARPAPPPRPAPAAAPAPVARPAPAPMRPVVAPPPAPMKKKDEKKK
jgi:hypothetical protein